MKKYVRLTAVSIIVLLTVPYLCVCYAKNRNTEMPVEAGQRYLFLDDHWISEQSGVTRTFHAAVKEKNNPVITGESGDKGVGPFNFVWGSKQSPYSAWFGTYGSGVHYPQYFRTSIDGFNWSDTYYETDVLNGGGSMSCYVLNKSDRYVDYPYLCAQWFAGSSKYYHTYHWELMRSRDGVHWEAFPGNPVWDGPSDVMSIQWDERKKKFIAHYKVWRFKGVTLEGDPFVAYGHLDTKIEGNALHITGTAYLPAQTIDVKLQYGGDTNDDGGGGITDRKVQMTRVIGYAESSDFVRWENERIIIEPPPDAPLGDQSYGMQVTCYGNMYIGMYNHFNGPSGLMQTMLAWSYDGIHYTVHDRQFFIASGKPDEWDYGMIVYPSELTDAGNGQQYVYYGSMGVDHLVTDESLYRGALGRAWIRRDGFASLSGGRIETVPVTVQSGRICVNMTGEIVVSLKSVSGEAIGEAVLRGDYHDFIPDIDLTARKGKEVVVHLDLSRGELFSITL